MFPAKAALVIFYLATALSLVVPFPGAIGTYLQYGALALLVIHTLEIAFNLTYLRRHPGGLVQSILLCLLFGIGHWGPFKKQATRPAATGQHSPLVRLVSTIACLLKVMHF